MLVATAEDRLIDRRALLDEQALQFDAKLVELRTRIIQLEGQQRRPERMLGQRRKC